MSGVRGRREDRIIAEYVVERWIGIDGVTAAHDHLFVEGWVPCESDARLEVFIEVIDCGYGAYGQRQSWIPKSGGGIGLSCNGLGMKLVIRLAQIFPTHSNVRGEAGSYSPVVLNVSGGVKFGEFGCVIAICKTER